MKRLEVVNPQSTASTADVEVAIPSATKLTQTASSTGKPTRLGAIEVANKLP